MAYTIKNPKQYSKALFRYEQSKGKSREIKIAKGAGGVSVATVSSVTPFFVPASAVGLGYSVGVAGNKRYIVEKGERIVSTNKNGYSIVTNRFGGYDVIFPYGKHFYTSGVNFPDKKLAEAYIKEKLPEKPSPFKTFAGSAFAKSDAFTRSKGYKTQEEFEKIAEKERKKKSSEKERKIFESKRKEYA